MSRRTHFDAGHKKVELTEAYLDGEKREPAIVETGDRPEYLYRSMHPAEWESAQKKGYLQSEGDTEGGGRVLAAPWADPQYATPGTYTVRIKYSPEDRWRTRWSGVGGKELTAWTDKVPINRVQIHSINPIT